ncbi:MAG: hypothetical protein ACHQ2Z_13910 [Elusimicrobiota bacterium]
MHLGMTVDAYRLFQGVNALAGALGLLLFGDAARRLSRDAAVGWCAALLLGGTWCYGTRATEGQVYMSMSLGAIAVLWASVRLLDRPTVGRAAQLMGLVVVSALFHAANASLFPAAAAALWLAFPNRRRAALAGAAAGPFLLIVIYILIFGSIGLRGFLETSTDFHASSGGEFWSGLFAMFMSGGGASPWGRLLGVCRETGTALMPMTEGPALAAGLLLWSAAGGALWRAWPRLDALRRSAVSLFGATWAAFTVVSVFWQGGLFFYVPALACLIGILATALGALSADLAAGTRRRMLGILVFTGLALAFWNLRVGLIPQSRLENNSGYRQAMFVGAHTEPASWIIISGLGFSNSKVYIPRFAHRRRQVLEFFFDRNPKDAALRKLSEFFGVASAHGIPMYLLSDLAETPGAAPILEKRFGVSRSEIMNALGAGRIIGIAHGPDERVYLFVPRIHQSELFTVYGYSMLTDNDDSRTAESMLVLQEIARGMSPIDRRNAGELLRKTSWGFDLVWEDLSRLMSPESMAATKPGARLRFGETQKTPDFWLRAGNLYAVLGIKAETLNAWARAQEMSGDTSLLKRIGELRISK